MRRILVWSGIALGVVVAIAGILVTYAFFNLSSIVSSNQHRILNRVSAALGRAIAVQKIQARAGWGVYAELTGLTIADDPAFSKKPFIAANEVSAELEFIPILRGEVKVKRLEFLSPDIQVLMNAKGDLNLDSLGGAPESPAAQNKKHHGRKRSALADLSIASLSIQDGAIYYTDLSQQAAPIQINHIALEITNFSAVAPFDTELTVGILGEEHNSQASGKVGPILKDGVLDLSALPLDLKFSCDSILLERVRALAGVGALIPKQLSISDPFPVSGTIKGSWAEMPFTVGTDLTAHRVAYAGAIDKPAGTALEINLSGTYTDQLNLSKLSAKLADLELTATNIVIASKRPPSARIDTNSFSLASLAAIVTPMASYQFSGNGELHGNVKLINGEPDLDGTLTLNNVATKPGPSWPAISQLNGTFRFQPGTGVTEKATFAIGSSKASLEARVASSNPLNVSYTLQADALKLADLYPDRPAGEIVSQIVITGTADGELSSPRLNARIKSPDGQLANIGYRNLDITAAYKDGRLVAIPLKMNILDGSISAQIDASFDAQRHFTIAMMMNNLNVEQGLRSQSIGAAGTVHGFLSGNVTASGAGSSWDRIKPTLRGSGRLALANGKLVGVNIVADAINAVAAAPGVSQIVKVAFSPSHHGLLVDPDTELNSASMSFQLVGPRFTTHDLSATSPDYGIRGDGWFDMDKNLQMEADITLSFGVQVAMPVSISGKLPDVHVLPDIPMLAERVAVGTITAPGRIIEGGVSAVGTLIRGGSSAKSPSIPNPLNAVKGWFQ